jgi:uncharacterized protein YbbK (DUF523 family)
MMNKILVSACLMGFRVRYNGSEKARMNEQLARWQQEQRLVIHCPELAAGLPVPRPPAEIMFADGKDVMHGQARIMENTGQDVTAHYQLAAWLALRAAQASGCSCIVNRWQQRAAVSLFMTDLFAVYRKRGWGCCVVAR